MELLESVLVHNRGMAYQLDGIKDHFQILEAAEEEPVRLQEGPLMREREYCRNLVVTHVMREEAMASS